MSLKRHVCRLPFHIKPTRDYVWISEDALDNAMRQFAHAKITRRHVSLAPGPMEATKRASKRRMVNLAQVGGGVGLDPSLLPGFGGAMDRRDWQWQSPKPPEAKNSKELAPLPHWLLGLEPESRRQTSLKDGLEKSSQMPSQREAVTTDPTFLAELGECQSLEQIRNWATQHIVDLRKYSRLAFRQLVQRGRALSTILQSLEEPTLDTPGNRAHFLERVLQSSMTPKDADLLGLWIKKQLLLGAWSEKEISNLAGLIAKTPELRDDEEVRCTLIASMFEGLQSSTVLGLQDVNMDMPGVLLEAVAKGLVTRKAHTLGITIIEALQPEQVWQLRKRVALFFKKFIRSQAAHDYDKEEVLQLEAIPRSLEVFRSLPENVAQGTVLETSKALLELQSDPSLSRQALRKFLKIWWSSLVKSKIFDFTKKGPLEVNNQGTASTRSQRMLADQPLEILAPYLRHFDDEGKARYLVRHWVCPALPSNEWQQAMIWYFKLRRTRKDESPFLHFLQVAHGNSQLPDKKVQRLFRLLQMMQMSETIEDILIASERIRIPISKAAVLQSIRTHMGDQPRMAERIFNAYPRLPIERCPDFVEKLILNANVHPNLALELYKSRKLSSILRARPGSRRPNLKGRASLLGRMAIAYSKAVHLTPRMAFRRIYRCYRCIITEHLGPVPIDIVHAFVRAGIVQPLRQGEWISTVKHRWILSLIRDIESSQDGERVDELVYRWRGAIARNNKQRNERILTSGLGEQESKLDFSFRTQWSERWSRYERVVTPLKTP